MKLLITIAISVILILALAVPAAASSSIQIGVTVQQGGGDPPTVKCKWEQDLTPSLENGDPSHATPLSQFLPPLVKNGKKTLQYFAVVTDLQDGGNVAQAFADVYHPKGVPAPYSTSTDPRGPLFKYEVPFANLAGGYSTGEKTSEIALVTAAYNAGLITFQTGYSLADVTYELNKGTAALWFGSADIDYEQPAGLYTVNVYAIDQNSNASAVLTNQFLYVPVAGVEVDFTSISYGQVSLGLEKMVAGDTTWVSPPAPAGVGQSNQATVRNIGNTWAHVIVTESDLGLGKDITNTWNVRFDARMGSDDTNKVYFDPNVATTLPNYLALSSLDELDFSILVKKGMSGTSYTGSMVIGASVEPFSSTTPTINK
jgi:hypothetical protein